MDASFPNLSLWMKKRTDLNLPVSLQRRPVDRLVAPPAGEALAGVDFWNRRADPIRETARFPLNRKD